MCCHWQKAAFLLTYQPLNSAQHPNAQFPTNRGEVAHQQGHRQATESFILFFTFKNILPKVKLVQPFSRVKKKRHEDSIYFTGESTTHSAELEGRIEIFMRCQCGNLAHLMHAVMAYCCGNGNTMGEHNEVLKTHEIGCLCMKLGLYLFPFRDCWLLLKMCFFTIIYLLNIQDMHQK